MGSQGVGRLVRGDVGTNAQTSLMPDSTLFIMPGLKKKKKNPDNRRRGKTIKLYEAVNSVKRDRYRFFRYTLNREDKTLLKTFPEFSSNEEGPFIY